MRWVPSGSIAMPPVPRIPASRPVPLVGMIRKKFSGRAAGPLAGVWAKLKAPSRPSRVPSNDSTATYGPTSVKWSRAAVNNVAERPAMSPSYCFLMVATPTGRPARTVGSGAFEVGVNATTLKVPEARMELMIENAVMRATWHIPGPRARIIALATVLTAAVGVSAAVTATSACAAVPLTQSGALASNTRFYLDPHSAVGYWDTHNSTSPYQPAVNARIAPVPSAVWFTAYDPDRITAQVSDITSAAAAQGTVPVLVLYDIPDVNCATNPPGAAPTIADYESWATAFAAGLGRHQAIVIVEPDALASQSCLSAQQASQRDAAIAFAGRAVHKADAAARVYFDAGNSAWNPASVQAQRLAAADVAGSADGIFSNVSNFRSTSDEVAYDEQVLADLGDPPGLHIVVDTSRNGNGPGSTWCDPAGRALGHLPTADTGNALVDAYLWIKDPGQADGCAAPAGSFDPELAYALIANGPGGAGTYAAKFNTASPAPTAPTTEGALAQSPQPTTGQASNTATATAAAGKRSSCI